MPLHKSRISAMLGQHRFGCVLKLAGVLLLVFLVFDLKDAGNNSNDSTPSLVNSQRVGGSGGSGSANDFFDASDNHAHREVLKLFNQLMPKGRGETPVDEQDAGRMEPRPSIVGSDATVDAMFERLGNRSIVRYCWVGGTKDDDDLIDLLSRIAVPQVNPEESLLEHVHRAAVALAHTEKAHGPLIVGLGTGQAAYVRFKHQRSVVVKEAEDDPAAGGNNITKVKKNTVIDVLKAFTSMEDALKDFFPKTPDVQQVKDFGSIIYRSAKRLRSPAMFHQSIYDIDLHGWAQRMPRRWRGVIESLTDNNPLLFFVHCDPTIVNKKTGQLGKRVIPFPHQFHLEKTSEYAEHPQRVNTEMLVKRGAGTISQYLGRPRKVIWRGTTMGNALNESAWDPYGFSVDWREYTDRGRIVSIFNANPRFRGINNVGLNYIALGQGSANEEMGGWKKPSVKPTEWREGGRALLDVDGFSNSWEGLRWKLLAGGPVLKVDSSEGHVQWYYHLLQDEVHLRMLYLLAKPVGSGDSLAGSEHANIESILTDIEGVLDKPDVGLRLMRNAIRVSVEVLTPQNALKFAEDSIANCWENVEVWSQMDWRVRRA